MTNQPSPGPVPADRAALTRRDLVIGGLGAAAIVAGGIGGFFWKAAGSNQPIIAAPTKAPEPSGLSLPPTPCDDTAIETTSFVEGPFYSPNSPHKTDLRESGYDQGDEMVLSGRVHDSNCRPVAGAVLDFWQVDHRSLYDNAGFRYRGHLFSDSGGQWQLRSIHPTSYTLQGFWTTAHLHVKVQGPNSKLLTTQLFFPRAAQDNAREDGWRPELQVEGDRGADDIYDFRFDFVLAPS